MTRWQDKLTKKQLKHLKESKATTLKLFWKTRAAQEERNKLDNTEGCWECRFIARTLKA